MYDLADIQLRRDAIRYWTHLFYEREGSPPDANGSDMVAYDLKAEHDLEQGLLKIWRNQEHPWVMLNNLLTDLIELTRDPITGAVVVTKHLQSWTPADYNEGFELVCSLIGVGLEVMNFIERKLQIEDLSSRFVALQHLDANGKLER